jgi:hypothetical protein
LDRLTPFNSQVSQLKLSSTAYFADALEIKRETRHATNGDRPSDEESDSDLRHVGRDDQNARMLGGGCRCVQEKKCLAEPESFHLVLSVSFVHIHMVTFVFVVQPSTG